MNFHLQSNIITPKYPCDPGEKAKADQQSKPVRLFLSLRKTPRSAIGAFLSGY